MFALCDRPDRPGARVFLVVCGSARDCPCCSFYRGVLAGAIVVAILAGAIIAA
jgi:hypothetical protein